jgi:hypothetical protein
MQEKGFHLLSAESEAELDEWVVVLKRVIQNNEQTAPQQQFFNERMRDKGSCGIIYTNCFKH